MGYRLGKRVVNQNVTISTMGVPFPIPLSQIGASRFPLVKRLWQTVLMALLCPVLSYAQIVDNEQPLVIEAGQAKLDSQQRRAIYTTEVVITQGTLRLKGDTATVYFNDDNRIKQLLLKGSPAEFRKLAGEQSDSHTAHADQMQYTVDNKIIVLLGNANYTDGKNMISAHRINYNIVDERISANTVLTKTATDVPILPTEGQRVRVKLQLLPQ